MSTIDSGKWTPEKDWTDQDWIGAGNDIRAQLEDLATVYLTGWVRCTQWLEERGREVALREDREQVLEADDEYRKVAIRAAYWWRQVEVTCDHYGIGLHVALAAVPVLRMVDLSGYGTRGLADPDVPEHVLRDERTMLGLWSSARPDEIDHPEW